MGLHFSNTRDDSCWHDRAKIQSVHMCLRSRSSPRFAAGLWVHFALRSRNRAHRHWVFFFYNVTHQLQCVRIDAGTILTDKSQTSTLNVNSTVVEKSPLLGAVAKELWPNGAPVDPPKVRTTHEHARFKHHTHPGYIHTLGKQDNCV